MGGRQSTKPSWKTPDSWMAARQFTAKSFGQV
jgi:hypothetical protein